MSEMPYQLDYLFIAETYNGNIIKQSPIDTPHFADQGSSFTDVMKEHIKKFSLVGKGHIFTISLEDGHLEVDGNKLYPPQPIMSGVQLQLIYYRQVQQRMAIGPDGKQLSPVVRYFLGWQYNHNGKNHKWEMGVD